MTDRNGDVLEIPGKSFAAFRLRYKNLREVSHNAKCILLGGVPKLWMNQQDLIVLGGLRHHVKGQMKLGISSIEKNLRDYEIMGNYNDTSSDDEGSDNLDDQDGEFNIFAKRAKSGRKRAILQELISEEHQKDLSNERANKTRSLEEEGYNMEQNNTTGSNMELPSVLCERPSSDDDGNLDEERDGTPDISLGGHFGLEKSFRLSPKIFYDTDSVAENDKEHKDTIDTQRFLLGKGISLGNSTQDSLRELSFSAMNSTNPELENEYDYVAEEKECRHQGHREIPNSSYQSDMRLQPPLPYHPTPEELCKPARKNLYDSGKIKKIAENSKQKMTITPDMKQRLIKKVWSHYKAGDIIKMDKMLVMIKRAVHVNLIANFEEVEPCQTVVHERWKEYLVTLRRSPKSSSLLSVQLYGTNSSAKDFKRKPEYHFEISTSTHVQFYSQIDKSISICVSHGNNMFAYIMKCKDHITAFNWMNFIKNMTSKTLENTFNVLIPSLKISLRISIPQRKIFSSFIPSSELKLHVLPVGYKTEHCKLIESIEKRIMHSLHKYRHLANVNSWLQANHETWFCFKEYDRIEWITDNSELLYVQNQLLFDRFQLELRERSLSPCITHNEKTMKEEPIPFEGFLARLTNSVDSDVKMFKSYYKLAYFYTCDNLLFFTKFFRAVPPSPDNILMESDYDNEKIARLPQIYLRDPFPLDKDEHIIWLEDRENFEANDTNAMKELERRASHVIKSSGMIDLCQVADVNPIPLKEIKKVHQFFLGVIWYEKGDISDEGILDSCFEIKMKNGGVMKLQAPNRFIRDSWICKLIELKNYWTLKKLDELNRIFLTREKNVARFKTNEYSDSNFLQQYNPSWNKEAFADPCLSNYDNIALSKCVLLSGYLYQKHKIHSNFHQYYVVLCPGYLVLFVLCRRSKLNGTWKNNSIFRHYLTIPISDCYLYSGNTTALDLLENQSDINSLKPGQYSLSRIYKDGWSSSEEEPLRCFTLWFGKKRNILRNEKGNQGYKFFEGKSKKDSMPHNPNFMRMTAKFGITGKSTVFMARSRQERELWVQSIYTEMNRFARKHKTL